LKVCWADLEGSGEEGMHAGKLIRAEDLTWHPPILSFVIERHGGTVFGSTRAELHRWEIDVAHEITTCDSRAGRRQVEPASRPLNVKPLAEEIARHILSGSDHAALKWSADRLSVRILIGRVIPSEGFQQTIAGRRRRFKVSLRDRLPGWREVRANVWERT
jgi:hypothetical protein